MDTLPADLFMDPAWHALTSQHSHLAVIEGDARRYPVNVAPFAALAKPTELAMWELHSLLAPGEYVWLFGTHYPQLPELRNEGTLECLQMVLTRELDVELPDIDLLSGDDADAMVDLTDVAFPGFFRSHTYQMGTYYGVWRDSQLIAMAGERLKLDGYSEISGVCTHPAHRGKGLAANLIGRVAQDQVEEGVVSFLHVTASNTNAIELYRRLGFVETGRVMLTRIARPG